MIWWMGNKGMLGSEVARQLEEAHLPFVGTEREVYNLENLWIDQPRLKVNL